MTLTWNHSLGCVKKHANSIEGHLEEVEQKAFGEIDYDTMNWNISPTNRSEALWSYKNHVLLEEHIQDIISQNPNMVKVLGPIADEMRKIRQNLTKTGIYFDADDPNMNPETSQDAFKVLCDSRKRIHGICRKIDRLGTEMAQEETNLDCPRCKEDFDPDTIDDRIKKGEIKEIIHEMNIKPEEVIDAQAYDVKKEEPKQITPFPPLPKPPGLPKTLTPLTGGGKRSTSSNPIKVAKSVTDEPLIFIRGPLKFIPPIPIPNLPLPRFMAPGLPPGFEIVNTKN